ncbi:cytochrome b/b6 domain-containing protein [Paracoccus sp. 1_MG-2023]|uniref:cytochrome b/b6 domain-containing protein n=1 Tax=unclassified Paracoccus (in: a-proteobacteria) TaxID=2688777 RepID=UPI001C08F6E1|nr:MULTISPECIES: cytochrome b/b6 domain-containing protein [unclassified Paracoccus (in: a-proteobacteria)]MBU2956513.1 cytochrome b/b6 domain-containing protein [Paracoccus sp. C2R09]MDO6669683.1 cytochrome b/b6 domain-containing protein [Paracoccus sp. 1_MG-2023]
MRRDEARRVRLWDPALRLFHWLLAVLVVTNWLLGKFGPSIMTVHFWIGYAILGLLAFRLVWGIVGPEHARFVNFLRGPRAVMAYLRHLPDRNPSNWPGHNPMGALSVVAMLGVLIWQAGSGLVIDPEDFVNIGPLADAAGPEISRAAVGWHSLGADLVLILVVLHVAVILFYRVWKNEDLVRPMVTGWKWVRRTDK